MTDSRRILLSQALVDFPSGGIRSVPRPSAAPRVPELKSEAKSGGEPEAFERSRRQPTRPVLRVKLVHVMTVPQSLLFLRDQVGFMKKKGLEIHAVASPGGPLEDFGRREGIPTYAISMPRRISPFRDLVALFHLIRLLGRLRPEIVQGHTPKGGLLGMLAAFLAGVPIRIYTLHGLPLETARGLRRLLLWCTEKTSCLLATRVIAVGNSLRDKAISETLSSPLKITVLENGSINGVDGSRRFVPDEIADSLGLGLRLAQGIPPEARVIGYVGRIVRDKGVEDLLGAWKKLREDHPDLHLLVAGSFEPQDPVSPEAEHTLRSDPRIHLLGNLDDMRPAYAAMDVLALPSYREGFPTVPLEAAAMGLPVVATQVTGCVDAVLDGITGTLVPPRNPIRLGIALHEYLRGPLLRLRHGEAGQARVLGSFKPERVWESFFGEYERLLKLKGLARAAGERTRGASPKAKVRRWPLATLLKRAIDIGVASFLMVLLSPLIALVACGVRWRLGRPILFRQWRPGLGGKPFCLYKFRTMVTGDQPDASRMTEFGRLLRNWSLDELPQLWNVLCGEMSLIGPRPLMLKYLSRYSPQQARRHEVCPGITGWAQVNGRNLLVWDKRFAMDVWYVDHWSIDLDLKILALTVGRVLSRSGISAPGDATMTEFAGSPDPPLQDLS